jgi:large subunit ribosomal protein L4
MLKAHHVSATGTKRRSKFTLPESFDGRVNEGAMYHAVRAFLSNLRQGTHSTKTRAEVSGGNQKPWRQKGTGRARQGTIRAPHWRGGGVVFGPRPRTYRVDLPRKVKRLARQSALNARAKDDAVYVIESLAFETPKTAELVALLDKLGLADQKVLLLTHGVRREAYLSGRNLRNVHVMPYADVTAYEVLWCDALVIEQEALGDSESPGAEDDEGGDADA